MPSKSKNLKQLILNPSTDFGNQQSINGVNDANNVLRLPRWTKQEILILIQGKKLLKTRSIEHEPEWDSVSSYCKRQGVNHGPIQFQKRWSNLAGDFKKIKEWESQIKEETKSFWMKRNEFKREKKLHGFFDRQVFDILDHGNGYEEGLDLAFTSEVLFDSSRSVVVGDDGLFSDKPHQPLSQVSPTQAARNVQHHLVKALERYGKMVSSQLEAQNMHSEQDREQRQDHVDNLVAVLNKLVGALGIIEDKL
ncbi:hypothetical protein R3W88_024195 [Solanum pinnatisectum]|uniref:Myb/SANT-like DNA-binding domain-containing protein n=1 Tax=Solanum pinnatisectum TaxID=50273 RepID=A0AAV9M1D9_9SOLN|nr:hypothetical protein R3W88_024195 [Solanum pinnatisectum]